MDVVEVVCFVVFLVVHQLVYSVVEPLVETDVEMLVDVVVFHEYGTGVVFTYVAPSIPPQVPSSSHVPALAQSPLW